jgi:hypothetical protein
MRRLVPAIWLDQSAFVIGELVLRGAQRPAGGLPIGGAHRSSSGSGGGLGMDPVQGSVDPLHDVNRS